MLAVIQDLDVDAQLFLQAALDGVDGAVSNALKLFFHSMVGICDHGHGGEISGRLEICDLALFEVVRFLPVQIVFLEFLHDLLGSHLSRRSAIFWIMSANSLCMPRGSLKPKKVSMTKATPPFPD